MKKDIISWIVAFISLIAIIISFLTLREMKNQREMGITPILLLNKFDHQIISNDERSSCDSVVFAQDYFLKEDRNSKPSLELVNLGSGPALDVIVNWDIDLKWLETFLKDKKVSEDLINYSVNKDGVHIKYSYCGSAALNSYGITDTIKLGHIASSNASADIRVPTELILPVMSCFKADWKSNKINKDNYYHKIEQEVKLSIEYSSIHNKLIKEQYNVSLEIGTYGSGLSSSDNTNYVYNADFNNFALIINITRI